VPVPTFLEIYAERIRRIIGEETLACTDNEELVALVLALKRVEAVIAEECEP
jgi:hypothetical protein